MQQRLLDLVLHLFIQVAAAHLDVPKYSHAVKRKADLYIISRVLRLTIQLPGHTGPAFKESFSLIVEETVVHIFLQPPEIRRFQLFSDLGLIFIPGYLVVENIISPRHGGQHFGQILCPFIYLFCLLPARLFKRGIKRKHNCRAHT